MVMVMVIVTGEGYGGRIWMDRLYQYTYVPISRKLLPHRNH